MADTDPNGWNVPASVLFENTDSLAAREISVVVRYIDGRAPQLLSIDIETLTPDSLRTREPLVLQLAAPRRPSSPTTETTLPYRTGAVLGRTGSYTFTIAPTSNTLGISAIGIEITDR